MSAGRAVPGATVTARYTRVTFGVMDADTVDRNWATLQQQAQQTARLIETLASKLQTAASAGDPNAREWLLDLKETALSVHQEEAQAASLMQSIHQLVDNHTTQYQTPQYQQPAPQPQQYAPQPQPVYQQPVYQQPQYGVPAQGGMLQRFLGGNFGSAIASGVGFGIGDELVQSIFD